MKYLFLAILFFPFIATAQFYRNDKFIGGTFSISAQQGPEGPNNVNKSNSFSVQPQVGFMLNEKLAVGGTLRYSYNHYETQPGYITENTFHGYGAGIFIRKFYPISDKFVFAINSNLNYSRNLDKSVYHRMYPMKANQILMY